MTSKERPSIGITGYGAYVPPTVLTNDELALVVDTSDEWIRRRTGIRTRRILSEDQGVLDMAVAAAEAALADAGVTADKITDIRVAVNTWMRFPSLATQVQRKIGAHAASAADVAAGCAGFVYAMEEAYNKAFVERVRHGRAMTSLVIGVDGLSHITDWTDRSTCVLLGDGAGAVVLSENAPGEILAIHTHAQGNHGDLLYSTPVLAPQITVKSARAFSHDETAPRPYLRMDGPRIYAIAVETMARDVEAVIARYNETAARPITVSDIGYLYPHQANLRIVEKVAERLAVPLDKVYTDGVVNFGNTSTASIPLGYRDVRDRLGPPPKGQLEIDVAFGAGLASGAILRRT
ncbi:MAG: beta-ketoacyl-ACP synthase 3 [Planctomycetota bacterium]